MDQHRGSIEQDSASWHDSPYICTLSNGSRHLGHVVKLELWRAYDSVHLNDQQNGFRCPGEFKRLSDAKRAVEHSIASGVTRVMRATADCCLLN
jgi:hypothetical protein